MGRKLWEAQNRKKKTGISPSNTAACGIAVGRGETMGVHQGVGPREGGAGSHNRMWSLPIPPKGREGTGGGGEKMQWSCGTIKSKGQGAGIEEEVMKVVAEEEKNRWGNRRGLMQVGVSE